MTTGTTGTTGTTTITSTGSAVTDRLREVQRARRLGSSWRDIAAWLGAADQSRPAARETALNHRRP